MGAKTHVRDGSPCACGCGRLCSDYRHRWATPACVPIADRRARARAGGRMFGYLARRRKFHAMVTEMIRDGRVRHEDLLAALQTAYRMGRAGERQACFRARKGAA